MEEKTFWESDFFKENWFKLSIAIAVILIGFSFCYYFVIFLPKKEQNRINEQKEEIKKQEEKEVVNELEIKTAKCLEDAKKFHENYIKSIVGFYQEPKYNYNQKLGRCLYSGGYSKNDNLSISDENFDKKVKSAEYYWERVVKDIYTNETILSTYNFQNTETIEAFWEEHDKLMNH